MLRSTLLLLCCLALLPVRACFSGLVLIPTTDTVTRGGYALNAEADSSLTVPNVDTYILNTEYGVVDNVEAGIDFNLSPRADQRALLNAKYRFWHAPDGNTSLAIGVCNLEPHFEANPYLVGTHDFGPWRVHAGMMGDGRDYHPFVGFDAPLNDRVLVMADLTEGADSYGSVGVNITCTPTFAVLPALELPSAGGNDTRFTVQLIYTGTFRKGRA